MTANEFESRVKKLVDEALTAGVSDAIIADVLHDVAESLREHAAE